MIKIYFTYNDEMVMLPANPPKLEVEKSGNNTKTELVKLGEVNILRTPKLAEIPLEGWLPGSSESPLLVDKSDYREPKHYISFFERVRADCAPVELAISDADIGIENETGLLVSIEDFSWYREGGDDDVYYTLKLCEYKSFATRAIEITNVKTDTGESVAVKAIQREVTKPMPKTYTVKPGDTLWAICKKELGDGGKYPQIASLNSIADANKIKVGQVLKLG